MSGGAGGGGGGTSSAPSKQSDNANASKTTPNNPPNKSQNSAPPQNSNNSMNRGGGNASALDRNKRKRGGGSMPSGGDGGRGGGGRNPFLRHSSASFGNAPTPLMGGGGGSAGFVERRPFNMMGGANETFDGPLNKRPKTHGNHPDGRVFEKLRGIQGPTADLPPAQYTNKKFLANTRLYIGNIAPDVTEGDLKEMFNKYGEIDELFVNREKNFAFLKLDFRTNAEKARAELDQAQLKNRAIKVRFAPATVRIKVKNLSPMVSNELLELGFSIFGDIEKALVFVDDKGRSAGEGIVDFTRKNNAAAAHKYCTERCFFLTADLRPVMTEMGDMHEMDEGLLELNLPREFKKGMDYYKAREVGPRFADEGSFEADYGEKWKAICRQFKEKEAQLKSELEKEVDKLQAEMEIAHYDYETEMLRQQLRKREMDHERQRAEWENRVGRSGGGGGGNSNSGGGGLLGPFGFPNGQANNNINRGGMGGGNSGQGLMDTPQLKELLPQQGGNSKGGPMPLAPPPMPPQGLMAHLHGGNGSGESGGGNAGPTWELPPRDVGMGRGRGRGFFAVPRTVPTPEPLSPPPQKVLVPNPLARKPSPEVILIDYEHSENSQSLDNSNDLQLSSSIQIPSSSSHGYFTSSSSNIDLDNPLVFNWGERNNTSSSPPPPYDPHANLGPDISLIRTEGLDPKFNSFYTDVIPPDSQRFAFMSFENSGGGGGANERVGFESTNQLGGGGGIEFETTNRRRGGDFNAANQKRGGFEFERANQRGGFEFEPPNQRRGGEGGNFESANQRGGGNFEPANERGGGRDNFEVAEDRGFSRFKNSYFTGDSVEWRTREEREERGVNFTRSSSSSSNNPPHSQGSNRNFSSERRGGGSGRFIPEKNRRGEEEDGRVFRNPVSEGSNNSSRNSIRGPGVRKPYLW